MKLGKRQELDRLACIRGARGGFTLIEVLIALSVLAVTMVATFSVFSSGLELRSVTRERMAFDRDARLLLSALANDLANLVPAGPAPMVGQDEIILWRNPPALPGETQTSGVPLLVAYRWSGSPDQDSLLVRVSTPLNIDIADSAEIYAEFLKWAGSPEELGDSDDFLVREEKTAGFGARATLNGLSGDWVGFARIRVFEFKITGIEEDQDEDAACSRLQVHLQSGPGHDLDMGFWLPWGVPRFGTAWPGAQDQIGDQS